jgi:hypothetical protein
LIIDVREFLGALGTFQIKSFVGVLGQIFPTKRASAIQCVDFKRVGFSHEPRKDLGGLRASIATLLSADTASYLLKDAALSPRLMRRLMSRYGVAYGECSVVDQSATFEVK